MGGATTVERIHQLALNLSHPNNYNHCERKREKERERERETERERERERETINVHCTYKQKTCFCSLLCLLNFDPISGPSKLC